MHWWPHCSRQLSCCSKCAVPTWFSWWTLRSCITRTSPRPCISTGTWWTLLSNQPWRNWWQPRRAWRALKACDKRQDEVVWLKKKNKNKNILAFICFHSQTCCCYLAAYARGTVLKCLQYDSSGKRFFISGEHIWGWGLFFIRQHKDKLKEMSGATAPFSYDVGGWEVPPPKVNRWSIIFLWTSGNTDKQWYRFLNNQYAYSAELVYTKKSSFLPLKVALILEPVPCIKSIH